MGKKGNWFSKVMKALSSDSKEKTEQVTTNLRILICFTNVQIEFSDMFRSLHVQKIPKPKKK